MRGSASPKKTFDLTQESFDQLLRWLDFDRERAGAKYEKIRSQLIKMFTCRGCSIPEELADRTINRVAGKLSEIVDSYSGDPALYFFGVGHNIHLEYLKKKPVELPAPQPAETSELADLRFSCLDRCMDRLSAENRELIMTYYGEGEQAKNEHKRELARRLGIGSNALCIRAYRIRDRLRKCVSECLNTEPME